MLAGANIRARGQVVIGMSQMTCGHQQDRHSPDHPDVFENNVHSKCCSRFETLKCQDGFDANLYLLGSYWRFPPR